MTDFNDALDRARAGDVPFLEAWLRDRDVNAACEYTATTLLLAACEGNQVEAVRYLLTRGADPNAQHRDGYQCWDSTRSRAIREALLAHGFSLVLSEERSSSAVRELRVLAPRDVVTRTFECTLPGRTLQLEVVRYEFPPPRGTMRVFAGELSRVPVISERSVDTLAGPITARIELTNFGGEARVRLFNPEAVASLAGSRSFWLPEWD